MNAAAFTTKDELVQPYIMRITQLDRMIHDPSRLALVTALEAYRPEALHFGTLQRLTGLSRGNISGHIGRLERASYVEVERRFVGKRPRASARRVPVVLTKQGVGKVLHYLKEIRQIRDGLEALEEEQAKARENQDE